MRSSMCAKPLSSNRPSTGPLLTCPIREGKTVFESPEGRLQVWRQANPSMVIEVWSAAVQQPVSYRVAHPSAAILLFSKTNAVHVQLSKYGSLVIPMNTFSIFSQDESEAVIHLTKPGEYSWLCIANDDWLSIHLDHGFATPLLTHLLNRTISALMFEPGKYQLSDALVRTMSAELNQPALKRRTVARDEYAPANEMVGKVMEAMILDMDEKTTIKKIAAIHHISQEKITQLFKIETGQTPGAFMMDVRLEKARQLLADARIPIRTVAFETGFASAAHFSRLFRNKTGETPKTFRRKAIQSV